MRTMAKEYGVSLEEIAFMGDDVIDIPAMEIAGYSVCPDDAHPEVKKVAECITDRKGGHGANRNLCRGGRGV